MSRLLDPPESYSGLCEKFGLRSGIPYVQDWSAAADFIELITDYVLQNKPQNILECGSGLTTLMLAKACQSQKHGQVISLESGGVYADQTRQTIKSYGLEKYSHTIHAPLINHRINGEIYQWYSLIELGDINFDMLVIDGPPGFIQKHSRYPALPLLQERLSGNCQIFMDDASRDDELEIVKLWNESYSFLDSGYIKTERGCASMLLNRK